MLSSNIHDSSQPLQCNDSCKMGCRDIDPPHSNKHRYVSMVSAAFCHFSILYQNQKPLANNAQVSDFCVVDGYFL